MESISTPDGAVEAIVATPPSGGGPGVLFFMDAFGLRPRIEEMAAEIASWGCVVMAPNVFHRDGTAADLAPDRDVSTPEGRQAFWQVAGARIGRLTTERVVRDIDGYVVALRARADVRPGPIGVVGFCMGARLAVRAAGRHPELVAACAGFHGGGLVTDAPDSPHRELATARAEFVFGHADNDRSLTPEDASTLGEALAAAGLPARNEIYAGTTHGYTMADTAAWDEAACRRAFDNLRDLFDRTLR